MAALFWDVNRRAAASEPDRLMVHASAVARDDEGWIFAAPSESGKSTLAAGLLARGFSYMTDEAVAIDLRTGVLHGYAKPLSIDPGSQPLLAHLRPRPEESREWSTRQWLVPPPRAARAVRQTARLRLLVFPRYAPTADTALSAISTAEAAIELCSNSFNFHQQARAALPLLPRLLADVPCYRLTVSNLDDACELVEAATRRDRAS
jgi:hypothetical protein